MLFRYTVEADKKNIRKHC